MLACAYKYPEMTGYYLNAAKGMRTGMSQQQEQSTLIPLPEVVAETIQAVMRFTNARRESFANELQEWLETASASNNPVGLNAMAALISNKFEQLGMISTIFPYASGNAVGGEIRGENFAIPPILLLGHHDTVYAEGVSAPPVRLEADRFYGPGTVDMKACLLQALYALEGLLVEANYRDFNKILFLSLPDEEAPTEHHLQVLEQFCQEQPLVLVLEGATSPGNIVLRRKGCGHYKLTAQGVSAHAGSNPEKGRSAVLEIAHQTVQFCALDRTRAGVSVNAAPISGGVLPNVVADRAEVSFDLRFLREEDHDAIVAQWRALIQRPHVEGVKLHLASERVLTPPMRATEASLAMAEKARAILSWQQVAYAPENRGGGSDGCWTSASGCPTLDGFGAVGAGAHTPHEHILPQYVAQRAGLLAGMIAFLSTQEKAN